MDWVDFLVLGIGIAYIEIAFGIAVVIGVAVWANYCERSKS